MAVEDVTKVEMIRPGGEPLATKVELHDYSIVLWRSGAPNEIEDSDFREALALVLARLLRERLRPYVTLDPPPRRRLMKPAADDVEIVPPLRLKGSPVEQAAALVRASQGRSREAWPVMRLNIPWMPHYALASILDGTVERRPEGLSPSQLRRVEARHIRAAIEDLQDIERYTRFRDATGYWLVPPDGGEPLPPKKVFGVALAEALRTYTTPNDFSSGPLIFEIMRDRGFEIVSQGKLKSRASAGSKGGGAGAPQSEVPLTDEERRWIEGNPKFVAHMLNERSGAVPNLFKQDFRKKHGRLFCERCDNDFIADYGAALAEGCFEVHHTIPVSRMKPNHVTTPSQLELLCANCHRITHRRMAAAR